MIILVIFAFAVIAVLQIPGFIKRKEWGDLAAFSVLLAMGFVLNAMLAVDAKLPEFGLLIESFMDRIGAHF